MLRFGWKVFVAGILATTVGSSMAHAPLVRSYGNAVSFANITDARITESSGIAASRAFPGEYLTHNDSGDSARFFRFNSSGNVTGVFNLRNAGATDWEDMCSARIRGKNFVFLGDIGDNNSVRSSITIYRVEEPTTSGESTLNTYDVFSVTYPDGAHNCESMICDPNSGDLYLIIKASNGTCPIYRVPYKAQSSAISAVLVGTIFLNDTALGGKLTTGADASPDGRFVVLRTYARAYEYDVPREFKNWFQSTPRQVKLRSETQGEAICYSLDGLKMLTSSEGNPCPVSVLNITP